MQTTNIHQLSIATLSIATLLFLAPACANVGVEDTGYSTGVDSDVGEADDSTTAVASESGDSGDDSGDSNSSDDSDESDDAGPDKFDTLIIPDSGPDYGCKKVDIVAIVDNSGSMGEEQIQLGDSWEPFAIALTAILQEVDDYHLMGLKTDGEINAYCQDTCWFSDDACLPIAQQVGVDLCSAQPLDNWWGKMGCGVNYSVGKDASNTGCLYDPKLYDPNDANPIDRPTYLEGDAVTVTEGSFIDDFRCIVDMGVDGDTVEMPLQAMGFAFGQNDNGECNEGAIRSDAATVIIIVTDEDDQSPFAPEKYVQNVIKAKTGVFNPTPEQLAEAKASIAVLAIVAGASPTCDPDDGGPPRILKAMQEFEHHTCASINIPVGSNWSPVMIDFAQTHIISACGAIPG